MHKLCTTFGANPFFGGPNHNDFMPGPGVGDTIGIGPESRYQRAWYRNRNRILHIPGSQYRSRYRIFLFLGTPLNKFGHFFIFYLITFAKSWYQYRNRYRILPIPGSRNRYRNRPDLFSGIGIVIDTENPGIAGS